MVTNVTGNGRASNHANGLSNDANGMTSQNGHANGHANGLSNDTNGTSSQNGHANGHVDGLSNGANGMTSQNGHANGHANGLSNGANGTQNKNNHANGYPNSLPNGANETPVAICGMAMRLPGGIHNDNDLYKFLLNKRDARSTIGEDRYNVDGYYSPYGQDGTISTTQGYFLNDLDYSNLDLSMFTFSAAEAEQLDPNHRLVLEVVREAFESAGESEWRRKNIGTYVGMFTEDWQEIDHKDNQEYNSHRIMGGTDFALPNRIAYEYDLKGPSMVIKTACSSAGIGLHEALEAIRQEKITAALITGSNLILAPGLTISLSVLGSLSPEGSSKSFDASADGYARAEAVSAIYIKRLDEAIRDGNPIRAVIRSSATNVDGKTNGITMPNGEAHEALIRQAYGAIGLDMAGTAMVEAHGTGTKVGDPIEAGAIGRCFGENGVYIGASKPNLGHSEGAAALTSVMKAALSLENRTVLPNIKFNDPNPRIPWDALKLTVPLEPTPWPENKAERMSVNSYGIGGSNVHFVIDSAASFGIKKSHAVASNRVSPPHKSRKKLLLFSANHEESLKRVAENIEGYLNAHPERIDDTAYTLAQRREHMKLRNFSVFQGPSEPFEVSARTKYQGPSQAAFVFTGQGAQWVHMGRELMYEYPTFLDNIRSSDKILQSLKHAPSWSIEDVLCNSDDKSLLLQAEFSQPLCTALQIALVDLLATWSITPLAVVGHSSGELAAAYAAGALSAKDATIAAFYRGQVCKTAKKTGGMAAVGLGKEDVIPYLASGVRVACENSGSSVTLSGDLEVLEKVMAKIKEARPDVLVRKLQVEMAYHSHHMTLVGDDYHKLIAEHLSPRSPTMPFYSSVRAKVLHEASDFGPRYWQDNLESPVLFHSATRALLAGSKECAVHLEVGPHSALAGPLRQVYKEVSQGINYVSVLSRSKDDTVSFLQAVGQLHSLGVKISYPAGSEEVLTDLPSYPWHYEKPYWSETRVQKNWRFRKHLPHDLLGLRILEGSDVAPSWRNVLRTANVPWLNDHCIGDDTIFPAAGYLAIAGEAAFQINGVREYTVRDIEISKALLLYNDKSVEIVTNLQPHRFTSNSDSDWYTFQIVSHDGSTWNKHCSGLVRSGRASPHPSKRTRSLDRKVSSSRWYTTMARVGLNYTGKFARLENIAASVTEPIASAEVVDEQELGESSYMMHPSTLDLVFQTLMVAKARGIYRDFNKLFLPTFIEEFYVGAGRNKAVQINTASLGKSDAVQGDSYGTSNGELVFSLKGFQGKPMINSGADTSLPLNTLQLQWKPHPEFLKAGDLMYTRSDMREAIQICERLTVLCAIETRNAISGLTTAQPHLEKFRNWLNSEYERYQKPGYPLVEDSRDLVRMDATERQELIEEVFKQCEAAGGWTNATAIYRGYVNAADVFEGRSSMLDILLQDGVLTGVYSWMNDIWEFKDYIQLLGHAQPQMKILEIGAGTGGLTARFLEYLKSDYGERLYFKYTFSDISSGFFVQAQERFKEYAGIEYQALDISQNPLEQGFKAGEYDLIVASNVLHATPYLHETLTNVRTLLKPEGQLFLQEICPVTQTMSYSIGTFEGWWLAEEDGRADHPYISPEEWDRRLRDAGFSGCDSVTADYEQPYTWMANIIAKPAIQYSSPQKVTLLHNSKKNSLVAEVEIVLRKRGIEFDSCEWGQEPSEDQDIISFLDLGEKPLLQDIGKEDLAQLLHLIDSCQQSNILWLMPAAQINPTNPYAGQMLGLMRTIRSELAASFATLELEDTGLGAAGAVADVLTKVQRSKDTEDELDVDMEWAWVNGALNVGRFHWIPVNKDLCKTAKAPTAKGLTIRTPGLLQTLEWTSQLLGDPAPEEVHIKMTAVGLNYGDVLTATGANAGDSTFGLEGVGHITKLGSKVTNVAVGDRVMTVGADSIGMATVIRRPARLCIKIPDQLSDEEAATMPLVYVTVLMFLVEKWKLDKGQSILIHSAAGGIGICAIHVAQWLGAKIYATVGSEEKASFLVKEFSIPRNHIFNSRDSSFLQGIMEVTHGSGVDLVLNSLSGELLSASWKCVALDGAMIEIGKRDMAGKGQLALAPFEDNRTFLGGDATRFMATHESTVARLLELLVEHYLKGDFKPITPIMSFDAENIEEAFKYLQKGSHIGKIVINFPQDDTLPLVPTIPLPEFRGDGTYVLVGGLGGLGKAIAGWMASYGAKNLMFLSRSAGKSQEDQAFSKELNLMGCSTQFFAVDIADAAAVKEAVSHASLPIAGAMHMAMVLADRGIFDMDLEAWNKAVGPKIQGAWNLHNLLPKDMDFLVLFSSNSGTHGFYGQSNYASGNTFLDAFSQYRQSLGLPASVMSIGPIDDVGFVSLHASTKDTLVQKVANLLWETSFLDTLQLAIARSSTKYAPQPISVELPFSGYQPPNHIFHAPEGSAPVMDAEDGAMWMWKRDARLAVYRNIQKVSTVASAGSGNQLKQFLSSVAKEPSKLDQKSSADIITKELGNCISNFLMKGDEAIDLSLSLSDSGVDSLVAIEIRNWWKQNLGTDVSVLELLGGGSIEQLGTIAAQRLKTKYTSK